MKTSLTQFDLMITYMEQQGDLSKPHSSARGRLFSLNKWEELAQLLNSDGSGSTRTTEKWKKVWSDYKNNTKKKAARLYKAATGTGGGPATFSKLTDAEQRVLRITGTQVATGLMVEEAGLPQNLHQPLVEHVVSTPQLIGTTEQVTATPLMRAVSSPPHTFIEEDVSSCQVWNTPGPSTSQVEVLIASPPHIRPGTAHTFLETQVEEHGTLSPSAIPIAPAQSGQTPRRARLTRGVTLSTHRTSPRRRVRPAQTEQAAQQFLQAEEYWRQFKHQQHRDYIEMKREQNRIRESEIESQRAWQAVALRALDILDKAVNKYCDK